MREDRMYKDGMMEDRMYDGDMMKRGGRKRRSKKMATQQQIVNVKVKVGDTVQLQKGRAPEKPMIGQFRLLQGVGAKYANAPSVKQESSFGIAPSSLSPMYNDPVVVGGGSEYNKNKMDDVRQDTNPWGLHPSLNQSMRATPGKDMFADRRVNYDTVQRTLFQSEQPDKLQVPNQSPSMRGMPSQPSVGWQLQHPMASGPAMPAGSEMISSGPAMMESSSSAEAMEKAPGGIPWSGWNAHVTKAKERYPTLDLLKEDGWKSYKEYIEGLKTLAGDFTKVQSDGFQDWDEYVDHAIDTMRRGGRRMRRGGSVF